MASPPSLVYLSIYNPDLLPHHSAPPDDEDAQEQAQILFYTSNERAVSRDRMLRQVGLVKAIYNFADIFSPSQPCSSVHSQTRRMILVSPEPSFWIHACIDLAKSQRTAPDKPKGRDRKSQDKGKAKEPRTVYDYHDSSVHDLSLQSSLLHGYDMFKLKHGSFAYILQTLGREALELQLDRFFTVWAWTWDMEYRRNFSDHFGQPLHPLNAALLPLLDDFSTRIPSSLLPILINPPYCVISTSFSQKYSNSLSLARYLVNVLVPSPGLSDQTDSSSKIGNDALKPADGAYSSMPDGELTKSNPHQGAFLGLPPMNINMSNVNSAIDVRKWNWPGYLTFSKSSKKQTPELDSIHKPPSSTSQSDDSASHTDVVVDHNALEDAISSSSVHTPPDSSSITNTNEGGTVDPFPVVDVTALPSTSCDNIQSSSFTSFLADDRDKQATRQALVTYFTRREWTVVLVDPHDSESGLAESPDLRQNLVRLLDEVHSAVVKFQEDAKEPETAMKVLQPKDESIIAGEGYTLSHSGFASTAEQHYNSRQLQLTNPEVLETFSRGQNPQHFYVAKRGIEDKTVYMEVGRKEASLSDVENVLASAIRKFVE